MKVNDGVAINVWGASSYHKHTSWDASNHNCTTMSFFFSFLQLIFFRRNTTAAQPLCSLKGKYCCGCWLQIPGCAHQQQAELEARHWCCVQERDEQTLLTEDAEILQHVQQDAGHIRAVCCGHCTFLCCSLLGEQLQSLSHQQQTK